MMKSSMDGLPNELKGIGMELVGMRITELANLIQEAGVIHAAQWERVFGVMHILAREAAQYHSEALSSLVGCLEELRTSGEISLQKAARLTRTTIEATARETLVLAHLEEMEARGGIESKDANFHMERVLNRALKTLADHVEVRGTDIGVRDGREEP